MMTISFKKKKVKFDFFEHNSEPEDLRCLCLQSECIHLGIFCSHTHRKAIAHKLESCNSF